MFKSKKRAGAILGSAVAIVAVAGVAFAAYTATGGFDANGSTADAPQALTANADTSSIEQLYPGRCSDVRLGFNNPNDHDAVIDTTGAAYVFHAELNGATSPLLVVNNNADYASGVASLVVPAHGTASLLVGNLLCLSPDATNDDAGKGVHFFGSVPFKLATESEYPVN